ncbi:diguanylate cyclase [Inhella crocodyli]|uniref:diguanylate cyclase n=1 Tax=Inhella crocodyli TaxID=2499851 RepID=A0A437LSR8_9BURK|nr:diguanylate cyclase [Inhella crocodyli]RVT88455.1 diguanylate cyclase [Inhella crocodyli]
MSSMPLPPLDRPRLLVVDEQPANIQALYRTFASDHQVFMATSGRQALELAQERRPDLVLLDLDLPDLDGFEVCTRLQADPATRHIPVVFVTAHNDEAAEARGLALGAVDFIGKPIRPAIVRARVQTHLLLKRQGDVLRDLAFLDGLTGLHNRRAFDERLAAELRHAARDRTPLSLVMIDVDRFKRYNDHYGHLAGDDALRQVAAALRAGMLRPMDLVTRFGGEEFACVLPGTDLPGALAVAERLRAAVAALRMPHPTSEVQPHLSISLGVACTTQVPVLTPQALLAGADAALYQAKSAGRDRVQGFEPAREGAAP